MTPHKQLIKHDPASGAWGDCWRTCIACLLDMSPADVPHFADQDNPKADEQCREWLKERGFNLVKVCMFAESASFAADWFRDAFYILTGLSPNVAEVAHCVIGRGAFDVVWDPAQPGKGLAGPWVDEHGNNLYWIEFIVPMSLAPYKK